MNNMLYLEDVNLKFRTGFSLNHLSFQVARGEIFGFLGPSGAGKTTTIKLLTKQLKKDSGTVRVFGRDIEEMKREDFDHIGTLSDTNGLYERMTIEENLNFFADLKNVPKHEVAALLKKIHLYEQRKTLFKKSSKGMRQRVILAAAILHKPTLLFLDEPTGGLDPATIQAVHKILLDLNQNGTTIFLTTHNMEEADKLCTRLAIINNGAVLAVGVPADLKLRYAKNTIEVIKTNREKVILTKTGDGYRELNRLAEAGECLTIHTREPNLVEIFLELTGREF